MTEIVIDRVNMERILNLQTAASDSIDSALGGTPTAVDGGIASGMIAFIASAGAEASGLVADAHRALAAIALDVLDDASLTEAQMEDQLDDMTEGLEQQ
jgi:hypothetical protein